MGNTKNESKRRIINMMQILIEFLFFDGTCDLSSGTRGLDQNLSPCRCCKETPRVLESWLLTRLPLVLGPAGEEIDGRGRDVVEGGRSCCDGSSVDGSFGEEGGGGRREASRGMDGRRRFLVGASESRLDMTGVLVGD